MNILYFKSIILCKPLRYARACLTENKVIIDRNRKLAILIIKLGLHLSLLNT